MCSSADPGAEAARAAGIYQINTYKLLVCSCKSSGNFLLAAFTSPQSLKSESDERCCLIQSLPCSAWSGNEFGLEHRYPPLPLPWRRGLCKSSEKATGLWITQKLLLIEKDVALKSKCTITGKDQRNKAGLFDFFTFCASFRCQEPPFPHSVSLQSLYYLQGLEEIAAQRTPPKLLLFFSRKIPPH